MFGKNKNSVPIKAIRHTFSPVFDEKNQAPDALTKPNSSHLIESSNFH